MSISIYIIEDHPIMRRGYCSLINRESDLEVVGESADGETALQEIAELQPDLVIIDIALEGISGIEVIKRLRERGAQARLLVVSMHDEDTYAERALAAGARGYLMKTEADRNIVDAIRRVVDGGYFVSDHMTRVLFGRFSIGQRAVRSPLDALSDREIEVFELIGRGRATREIAELLSLSPKTIETLRSRIKTKLGIETGPELVKRAILWTDRPD